ncbi:MAG: helix-turn-helix domain-containing protein [Chitinophagaceae bacterium]|nr:helix-turn-helix domain-containing protein [Chitinophagaceae bacterium]
MTTQIRLNKKELLYLADQKRQSSISLRRYNRINILLLLNKGKKNTEIEDFLEVDRITIWRTKKRYLEVGIEKALEEESRPGQPIKYTTDHEAELAALACGPCPEGRKRWTIRLLTKEIQSKPGFETLNRESVRLALKKMNVSLG